MNVENGAETAQFPGKEYINGIAVAVFLLLLSFLLFVGITAVAASTVVPRVTAFDDMPTDCRFIGTRLKRPPIFNQKSSEIYTCYAY
jgi:hypothetical protein